MFHFITKTTRVIVGLCLMWVASYYVIQIQLSNPMNTRWQSAMMFWKEYLLCAIILTIGYTMIDIK